VLIRKRFCGCRPETSVDRGAWEFPVLAVIRRISVMRWALALARLVVPFSCIIEFLLWGWWCNDTWSSLIYLSIISLANTISH